MHGAGAAVRSPLPFACGIRWLEERCVCQGDAAVVELLPVLAADSGFGAGHRIHALHALSDATHTPAALPRVCEALLEALDVAEVDARSITAAGSG
jgi:hypothetical protein